MKFLRALLVGGLVFASPLRAVYAPIPAQEEDNGFAASVRSGVTYDTNLFGAATNEIDSFVWTLAPRLTYSASPTSRSFFSVSYGLALDYFDRRPGEKLLDSHDVALRFAQEFSKTSNLDLNEVFMTSRNPESLLAGVPLNSDQSFKRNQIDGRFSTGFGGKIGGTVKVRSVYYKYRNAALGRSLDRIENLYGGSLDYAILPEIKAVGEYRHQDVYYRKLGETKNKRSDFVMAGADYEAARKTTLSGRFGYEWRNRASERDTTSPYAEMSAKYDYAPGSYVASGYAYTLEESSDTARFTDTQIHRFFLNVQHRLTALITASGSFGYEPSQLQGRRGLPNLDEDTVRAGLALSYLPNKHWTISASYDYDRTSSDDAARNLRRQRTSLNASYSF